MAEPSPQGATAIVVRTTKESARFAIRDLSAGGARLVGELQLFEGEQVWLRIELADVVEVMCAVTRVDRQRKVAEVAFRGLAPDALARIERSIADMVTRVRDASPPTVLIVHPTVDVSSALERDLARIGVAARVLGGLDDVAWTLAERSIRFIGVVVSSSFGEAIGPVLHEIETTHADLRRVMLHGELLARIDHPAAARVDAVLRTPWRFKGLARALDIPAENVVTTYDQLVALKLPIGGKGPKS